MFCTSSNVDSLKTPFEGLSCEQVQHLMRNRGHEPCWKLVTTVSACFAFILSIGLSHNSAFGEEPTAKGQVAKETDRKDDDQGKIVTSEPTSEELENKFTKLLTGAALQGFFTMDGQNMGDGKNKGLSEETYRIEKVQKGSEPHWWEIHATMKYGDKNQSIIVPLQVFWAGSTPVLTLDDITIPGAGTFSARVAFHKDKYAGTCQHDDKGGHLFGHIKFDERTEKK